MAPTAIIWLAFSTLACVMLFSLVRRQQAQLHILLENYIEEQKEWAKKKAKATRMARRAAKHKEAEEAAFLESKQATLERAEAVAREMDSQEEMEPQESVAS